MIILSKDQLKVILQGLPAYHLKSLQLEAMIRNKINGRYDMPGMEVVADEYPEYGMLMVRPIADCKEYLPWPRLYTVTIFSRDLEKLKKAVRSYDFLDWNRQIDFLYLPRGDVFTVIAERCKEMGNVKPLPVGDYGIMQLLDPTKLNKCDLPSGFYLGELTEAHAEQINGPTGLEADPLNGSDAWKRKLTINDSEEIYPISSLAYTKHLLRNKFPSSAVFTDDGHLVARLIYSPEGAMYFGVVQPEYRNKGFYHIVNYDLAKKVVAMGQPIPWVYVACWNQASLNAYRKMGAVMVSPEEHSVDCIAFKR